MDACNDSVGAVLLQETNGQLHPVEYFSTKYSPMECNWPIINKEFLAIYKACQRWRCYLDGKRTVVYTDHKPLLHLQT